MKQILLLFYCVISTSALFAQVDTSSIGLETLKLSHPRLLVNSLSDFDKIKEASQHDPFLKKEIEQLLIQADEILKTDTVKYNLNNQLGGQLLEVSRTVYRRMYILSMTYRLTGDKKYADRAWADLYAASRFPDWNPWHFLDVSEMLHGFAIGYDWLYDYWSPLQKKIIKQAIIDKGLSRAFLGYHDLEVKHLVDWPKSESNWNQVCSAGIGMAALAIADEEPKLCKYLIKQAVVHIPQTMKRLAPDGASEEGPGYWAFGTQYNVALIESLKTALGTDYGLSKIDGFSKTGLYFLAMAGTTGTPFNYADCWMDKISAPELFWFAKEYNQPLLAKYQEAHPQFNVKELLWYNPNIKDKTSDLPLANYFRGSEVATVRSAWNDPKAWFLGFKAGMNTANHGHLDIGNFVLERNGVRWAVDLSYDSYALPGYFDVKNGKRWTYYRLKAEGHNTLVLDPDLNPDQNPAAVTTIGQFVTHDSSTFGIINMTEAYKNKASSVKRGIALQKNSRVLVQDEISSKTESAIHDAYWFIQTPAKITFSKDHRIAYLTIKDQQLKCELASPSNASFEVLEPKNLPQSAQSQSGFSNEGISRLTIHLQDVKNTTIAVFFKEMNDHSKNTIKPLSQW